MGYKVHVTKAWFLTHRIRMAITAFGPKPPMGSGGNDVEAEETYIGRKPAMKKARSGDGHGMKGIYQHCGSQHLHRYLDELDSRHNHRAALDVSDDERTQAALKGIEDKRLGYQHPIGRLLSKQD